MTRKSFCIIIGLMLLLIAVISCNPKEPQPINDQLVTLNIGETTVKLTCVRTEVNSSVIYDCHKGEIE